ncbi:MAG: hypothetical protein ACOCXJ_08410 [Planctomycetota bacterium]
MSACRSDWQTTARLLLPVLLTGSLVAADATVQPVPLPSFGPQGRLEPSLPEPSMRKVDPDQQLLQQLRIRMQEIDDTIRDILSRHSGLRPASAVRDLPELASAQDHRDAAWELLQEVISREESRQEPSDVLDAPAEEAGIDPEHQRLEAQNQLAVARCYYELATAGAEADVDALREGFEVVEQLEPEHLPVGDRPQLWYYRFVFNLELARRSSGPDREEHWQRALHRRDELKRRYPDSYLAITADSLVVSDEMDLRRLQAIDTMTVPES